MCGLYGFKNHLVATQLVLVADNLLREKRNRNVRGAHFQMGLFSELLWLLKFAKILIQFFLFYGSKKHSVATQLVLIVAVSLQKRKRSRNVRGAHFQMGLIFETVMVTKIFYKKWI